MPPLISVIITVYNGETYLQETLESLEPQNYANMEIIVIDDGSTDNTAEIAQNFSNKVRYVYQENQGQPSAYNHGLRIAKGEIIGMTDADDLWIPNRLEIQLPHLLDNPQTQIVSGLLQRFWVDEHGQPHYLAPERAMSFLTGLFRAEVFETVGLVTELLNIHDLDWFMRAREAQVAIHTHDDVVAYYRRHGNNLSTTVDTKLTNRATLEMLKRSLQRRRAQGKDTSLPQLKSQSESSTTHE